jgi:hypothetical protein
LAHGEATLLRKSNGDVFLVSADSDFMSGWMAAGSCIERK